MRTVDDPAIERFDIDWSQPGSGAMADWTSGWFWWRGYGTPAFASVAVGVAGDLVYPIRCRWADGDFYQMFVLRYDQARAAVDLIHQDPDSQEFDIDGDSTDVTDFDIDLSEFSPDIVFSQLAAVLDVALLTPEQATGLAEDPDDNGVWVPVDVGQGPVEFATADEIG